MMSSGMFWSAQSWWQMESRAFFVSVGSLTSSVIVGSISLAFLCPKRIISLDITPARNPDWTEDGLLMGYELKW